MQTRAMQLYRLGQVGLPPAKQRPTGPDLRPRRYHCRPSELSNLKACIRLKTLATFELTCPPFRPDK